MAVKVTGQFEPAGSFAIVDCKDVSGAITGSNISASGNIYATEITASGGIKADSFQSVTGGAGISFTDDLNISGNITASGNISGSGTGSFSNKKVSNMPAGADNSVVILDSDGFLKTD